MFPNKVNYYIFYYKNLDCVVNYYIFAMFFKQTSLRTHKARACASK